MPAARASRRSGIASIAERWTMCNGRFGAICAKDRISAIAYVSKDDGREYRNVGYDVRGPDGARGGNDICTSSPTESEIGGIISAWNVTVVGSSANSCRTPSISDDDTAGNSGTW